MALFGFGRLSPLDKAIRELAKSQKRQQELMAARKAIQIEAKDVQLQIDQQYVKVRGLSKANARTSGVKITPEGVASVEEFGEL